MCIRFRQGRQEGGSGTLVSRRTCDAVAATGCHTDMSWTSCRHQYNYVLNVQVPACPSASGHTASVHWPLLVVTGLCTVHILLIYRSLASVSGHGVIYCSYTVHWPLQVVTGLYTFHILFIYCPLATTSVHKAKVHWTLLVVR